MKNILKISVGATLLLSLIGCQITGEERLISQTLSDFEESLLAKDIVKIMTYYADSYSDVQGMNKVALRQILTGFKDSGGLDGLEISTDDAVVVMNDNGTATVGPMTIKAGQFNVTQTYTLVKEDGAWLFSTVDTVQN